MGSEVAIIGGGLAGLTCALNLEKQGIPYKLFESNSTVGGRVTSYTRKQLTVDKGFQVFLPHYKISRKYLDLDALDLCYYPSGAGILTGSEMEWFGRPLNYPKELRKGKKTKATILDYLQLGIDVLNGFNHPIETKGQCIDHFNSVFSKEFRKKFIKPFFRGVFLDPEFEKSINQYRYYLHCFFRRGAAVPKKGMKEIPLQFLKSLSKNNIEYDAMVTKVDDNAIWVNDKKHQFKHIVLATDFSTCYRLLNIPLPSNPWCSVTNYILAKKGKTDLAPLLLVSKKSTVSHINIPTLVSTDLAPEGTHYMNVSAFGEYNPKSIESEVHALTKESDWSFVWHDHIANGLPRFQLRPQLTSTTISVCGDWTLFPSIEGAILSGHKVAKSIKRLL